ncbi:MAG: hypothetical protein M1133_02460 [Armatimonadetes bacterium]|nr:hypothetical protein [Armatimonadota bacterium]
MGPVLHSLALLLLVPGSQLLTQPAGKSRFLYACTSALLVIIGLLLAMVKFSISPVRSGIYALIVIPVVLVAVVVSLMATHISNRAGKPLRLTLGFLLITLAWIVPGFLLEYFSVGE